MTLDGRLRSGHRELASICLLSANRVLTRRKKKVHGGDWQRPARSVRSATPRARAQHAAGNLDNRHVEILCAASACVNVSVFYQPLTAPTALGLLGVAPRRGFSRSGSAWLGRSQKDGLPTCCGDMRITVQGHQLAHRGSLVAAPSNRGGGNGRQDARPCFARLPVPVMRNLRLGGESRCF